MKTNAEKWRDIQDILMRVYCSMHEAGKGIARNLRIVM